jgi:hypothetical protein
MLWKDKSMPSPTYETIYRLIESMPVVSTHEHHLPDDFQNSLTLDRILERERSYVGWVLDLTPGLDAASRAEFLAQCRHNSYFVWLEKGIRRIYGLGERLTPDNWENVSRRISELHADRDAHLKILTGTGRYRRAIEDAYFDPGSNLGHPELFASNFRSDMFVRCFHSDVRDHDNMNPWVHYPDAPTQSFDEYLDWLEARVIRWRATGGVALKSASAYDRPLSYGEGNRDAAARVFGRPPGTVPPGERTGYEDFMLNWFCRLAVRLELPFQVHTGLAQLSGSRPLLFEPTIMRHPDLLFVLFHAGFPWYGEIAGLAHNHANVSLDMVWAPLISASAAVAALHQFLEVARSSDRIAWGSDTWTSEEAVGALLAWQHVVATVLAEKVDSGYFDMAEAEILVHKLMYRNAARLYGFDVS